MTLSSLQRRLIVGLGLAGSMHAQNAIQHYSGANFASRGSAGTSACTLLQRLPNDQICGATAVHSVVHAMQGPTVGALPYTLEIRRNDPAGPSTGAPDMLPSGLVAGVPLSISIPPNMAFLITTTPSTPITLPVVYGVPAGDVYVGLALGAATATSGLRLQLGQPAANPMRPGAIGYTGIVGEAGMGWEAVVGNPPRIFSSNIAWNIRTRFTDDIVQPFVGSNAPLPIPDFGYAALFPDTRVRGDSVGWRALARGSNGDLAILFVGPAASQPIVIPDIGTLCLATIGASPLALDAAIYRPASQEPAGTVSAVFGPYSPLPRGPDLHAQVVNLKVGLRLQLSVACRVDF